MGRTVCIAGRLFNGLTANDCWHRIYQSQQHSLSLVKGLMLAETVAQTDAAWHRQTLPIISIWFLRLSLCLCCAFGCQHLTLNRLFGCVFLVWRHHLWINKSSVCTFRRFFSTVFLFFDVPQYSNRFDYIKDIRPAIYFNNQKNHCISSLKQLRVFSIVTLHMHVTSIIQMTEYTQHWYFQNAVRKRTDTETNDCYHEIMDSDKLRYFLWLTTSPASLMDDCCEMTQWQTMCITAAQDTAVTPSDNIAKRFTVATDKSFLKFKDQLCLH